MKTKLSLLAAAGVIALSSSAFADNHWYGSVGAGIALDHDDLDLDVDNEISGDIEVDSDLVIQGAIGRHFERGFRAELELADRGQDISELSLNDNLPEEADGDIDVTTLMLNVYRDFAREGSRIVPYLGLGAGVAEGDTSLSAMVDGAPFSGSDDDTVLAIQGLVGFAFAVSENIDLDLRYKHLRTDDFEYSFAGVSDDVLVDYKSNELSLNLRSNFGVPPAPVTPVESDPTKTCWDGSVVAIAVDCPPEIVEEVATPSDLSLTVYFDYDKSNLTPAADSLISAKTAEAKQYDISSVDVSGNADASGSSAYNTALSARRANVVRDALVANGVNSSLISVEARGEDNLAKQTEDGVREPLNRRVEVQYNF